VLPFSDGKRGGGETAPQCWRRTIQRRVVRRPGRLNAAIDVCKSKMTKENWVGGPNARLSRIADLAGEKNMADIMR
jgi:hypothetical protein